MKEYFEFKIFASLVITVCVVLGSLLLLGVCHLFKKQLTKNAAIITCVISILISFIIIHFMY